MVVLVDRTFFLWVAPGSARSLRDRRLDGLALGRTGADVLRPPHHLERELGVPHVRQACVRHDRPQSKSVDRRSARDGRRLAQQPPCVPRSAVHGIDRWQLDASAWLITGLEYLRLARNVQRIAPDVIARKRSDRTAAVDSQSVYAGIG